MSPIEFTFEMGVVLALLGLTVFLFVSELVRIDLAAILVMLLLGLLSYLPGLEQIADPAHLFDGFASNAVMSIIAVMIIGASLDKTGLMARVAGIILRHGGRAEKRIIPIVSGTVAVISSFMQNVGAAALFLPVVSRISVRTGLPMSRLLMPMGFCAILGGTMTMVGSSPLILLNDLVATANTGLPPESQIAPFSLFSVTPIGLALVSCGIAYFVLVGRWVLPDIKEHGAGPAARTMEDYLAETYGIEAGLYELDVPLGSQVAGMSLEAFRDHYKVNTIGYAHAGRVQIAPVITVTIDTPCRLVIIGAKDQIADFAEYIGARLLSELDLFAERFSPDIAGVAEIVIPPDSKAIGESTRTQLFRKVYGMSLLSIRRGETRLSDFKRETLDQPHVGHVPLQAGDTMAVFISWDRLIRLKSNRDFVIVTSDYPQDELRPHKVGWAVAFFLVALSLILFSDIRLSICLLVGAAGMLLSRVLSLDEAYAAVGWNTVFLLASLLPLGLAVQNTGTADWIAQQIVAMLQGWPSLALQAGLAILATAFTLVMSNIGATVLLVPLAISIAVAAGADPALFAMTVAIATSNSFLLPTHQVNALLMGPGGYRVKDFLKAGGLMTVLFLIVSLFMLNLVF